MALKLVLFINGVETYASCEYPPTPQGLEAITPPTDVYVSESGLDKTEDYDPNNPPSIDDFEHEYKIMWKPD